jgi:SSS family solute:Na+ symporter
VRLPEASVSPDDAFPTLMTLVLPTGYGLQGLVAAGLVGAILSTLDSLMNSGATLAVVDLYQKHVDPNATDARLVGLGRIAVLGLAAASALMATASYDPESRGLFFLGLVRQISYLTPGMLVAFLLGMALPGARARGALAAMAAAPALGLALEWAYPLLTSATPLSACLGPELNFMHRNFLVIVLCTALHVLASRTPRPDPAARDRFARSGGLPAEALRPLALAFASWVAGNVLLATLVVAGALAPPAAGLGAAAFTMAVFVRFTRRFPRAAEASEDGPDDRLWAGLLAAATTFLLFAFF